MTWWKVLLLIWGVLVYLVLGVWAAESIKARSDRFWWAVLTWPVILAAVSAMVPLLLIQMAYMEIAGWVWRRR